VNRLRALAAINASVGSAEIVDAEATCTRVLAALATARPRLDAVRMAVSPDFLTLR
jgi:hypothetical protein